MMLFHSEDLFRKPSREEVLVRLSDFGLQLKAKKCTLMQTEVVFLGHIVGRTGLACDPAKLLAVRNWHPPDKVKAVHQFVGFVGYYRRFVKDFAELAEPLVALTRKGAPFVWTDRQQNGLRRALPVGHGRQPVRSGGSSESDSGRLGSGYRVCQPQPSPVSAAILHDTSRNAGGSSDVHVFLVICAGGSVHPSDRAQLFAMATEVLQ